MGYGYLIDPCGHSGLVELPETIEGYYKLLGCNTIDIVTRNFGGHYYDVVCDDEGLFQDNVKVSAVDKNGQAMLVGKLFICKDDGKGNEIGLDTNDVDRIEACICTRTYIKGDY